MIEMPDILKSEHDEFRRQLLAVARSGGHTGQEARAIGRLVDLHFLREEMISLPPLAYLRRVGQADITDDMSDLLEAAKMLKAELPRMLEEHQTIAAGLERLIVAATRENRPEAVQVADRLKSHARTEEEILYPAALLVGDYVRMKLGDARG